AGELFQRAAVAAHHRRAAADQLGHDFAQALRTHRRGDVHRAHHIGEQHGDLLVLRMLVGLAHRSAAAMAEPGALQRFGATRRASRYGRHPSTTDPGVGPPRRPKNKPFTNHERRYQPRHEAPPMTPRFAAHLAAEGGYHAYTSAAERPRSSP